MKLDFRYLIGWSANGGGCFEIKARLPQPHQTFNSTNYASNDHDFTTTNLTNLFPPKAFTRYTQLQNASQSSRPKSNADLHGRLAQILRPNTQRPRINNIASL